jgi:hypothetical protein
VSTFDGVLAQFNESYIDLIVQTSGRDCFGPRPVDIRTWDYPSQQFDYTDAEVSSVWGVIVSSPDFWRNLNAYDGVVRELRRLAFLCEHTHDCYFITSRVGARCKHQTERWLAAHGFPEPTVLITSHKGLAARCLNLDVYIDDRWENALDVATTKTRSYLLTRSWNRDYDAHAAGVTRIAELSHFVNGVDC